MQDLTHGCEQLAANGVTLGEIITEIDRAFPGIEDRLCEDGRIRPGIAVAIDGELAMQGLRTRVKQAHEIHFLPAISGGSDDS